MKTLFRPAMFIVAAAMTFVSCSKDDSAAPVDGRSIQLSITAGNPEINAASQAGTRTEMEGVVPYWSATDQIGVSTDGTSDNHQFVNTTYEKTVTATFGGDIYLSEEAPMPEMLYTYYPFTTKGVKTTAAGTGALACIPAFQRPTATSFDGKADLLIGNPIACPPVSLEDTYAEIGNLQFKRVGGILKIVLKDQSASGTLNGQHISTLSITTDGDNHLAGDVILDLINGTLSEPYSALSNSVAAEYTSDKYEVNGTNATYMGVYPRILPAGSKLTVEAETEVYTIKKEVTLTKYIDILAGKVTTLNVTLSDANITVAPPAKYYKKITSNLADWSGEYLILGYNRNICFSGTVSENWGIPSEVVNTGGQVKQTAVTKSHACTIEKSGDDYLIKLPDGQYIAKCAMAQFQIGTTGAAHTIDYSATGLSQGVMIKQIETKTMMRCNTSSQNRFRYFTSTPGVSIDLYKLAD